MGQFVTKDVTSASLGTGCYLPLFPSLTSLPPASETNARVRTTPLKNNNNKTCKAIPYSEMSVGVPKEITPLEKRVAQTPDTVAKLVKLGITVNVEAGAGEASKCSDKGYEAVGANIVGKDKVRFFFFFLQQQGARGFLLLFLCFFFALAMTCLLPERHLPAVGCSP